jgi:hypothetical protein
MVGVTGLEKVESLDTTNFEAIFLKDWNSVETQFFIIKRIRRKFDKGKTLKIEYIKAL